MALKITVQTIGSTLWPMGSHWVQKWVTTVKNYHLPPNSNFRIWLPPRSSISTKIRLYGYGAKSRCRPPRVHFVAIGVGLGPKNGSPPYKITMPPNSNFRLPRGHRFRPKFDFTVMAQNHGADHLGSTLWPMGSHWVQKMGQHRKKLPCPQIRFFDYPAVIDFDQNSTLRLMGSHWVQKMGHHRKKLPCPQIRIFDYPAVIDFDQNSTLRLWRQSWGQ